MHPQSSLNPQLGGHNPLYQPYQNQVPTAPPASSGDYVTQFPQAHNPTPLPMSYPAYYQQDTQSPTLLHRQVTDFPQTAPSRFTPSAPFMPQFQPMDYRQVYQPMDYSQVHQYATTPVVYQVPHQPPVRLETVVVQATEPEFVAVPVETHTRTNRLINKINQIAAPHLSADLRPTLQPEAPNETYESLKREWRSNQNLYPPTYTQNINSAIREADHIVNNAQTKRSRVKTLVIALLILGGLALAAAVFKQRLVIDPRKMSIAKSICKIIAAVKLIQLGCSGISRVNQVAAARTQLYIGRAERNTDLVVGN